MLDLLVIIGAQLTVLFSIAAMNIYRLRTDVLTGCYIQSAADQSADADVRVLTGQPQTELPPGPGDGVCCIEGTSTHGPPSVEESPSPNSLEMPTTDRISALTTLAASLGFNERGILLFRDTTGSIGADDQFEPSSPMTSDLNARASNVASRSSGRGAIGLDPTGHVPKKIHA